MNAAASAKISVAAAARLAREHDAKQLEDCRKNIKWARQGGERVTACGVRGMDLGEYVRPLSTHNHDILNAEGYQLFERYSYTIVRW